MDTREVQFMDVRFPSVPHAQWALFFEDLGIPWQFRIMPFSLGAGVTYLPDFWLVEQRAWFQVGDDAHHDEDLNRWEVFARAAERPGCDHSDPEFCAEAREPDCQVPGSEDRVWLPEQWQVTDPLYSAGGIPVPEQMTDTGPFPNTLGTMHTASDNWYQWTVCPSCGFVGAEHAGRADRLACGHGDSSRDKNGQANHPRLLAAYRLARQTIAARLSGTCAECAQPINPDDLVGAGRLVGRRRWYHADCLLISRRERYRQHQREIGSPDAGTTSGDLLAGCAVRSG